MEGEEKREGEMRQTSLSSSPAPVCSSSFGSVESAMM